MAGTGWGGTMMCEDISRRMGGGSGRVVLYTRNGMDISTHTHAVAKGNESANKSILQRHKAFKLLNQKVNRCSGLLFFQIKAVQNYGITFLQTSNAIYFNRLFYGVNHFYITLEQYSQNTDISMLWAYFVKKHTRIIIQQMRDTS